MWPYQDRQLHKVWGLQIPGVHGGPGLLQDVPSLLEDGAVGVSHLAKTWKRPRRKHMRTRLKIAESEDVWG